MKRSPYKLRIPDEIVALVRGMHPNLKNKIRASFQTLCADPFSGKALKDELKGLRSFRVSRFRMFYRISRAKLVEIIAIGPRRTIYEETFKSISKGPLRGC